MDGCLKRLAIFFLCGAAGFMVLQSAVVLLSPVRMWETTGPVQVLTNGRETWLFFEFSLWKHRPGLLVSAPNIVVGHRQGVVVLSDDGAREYRLKDGDGPSFGPNLAYIFHHDGHFLLLESLGYGEMALSRWTAGESPRFERLDDDDMRRVLREEGLEGKHPIHLQYENPPRRHDGWTRVAATRERRPYAEPLRFDDCILSFEHLSFALTSPRPPFELILK